MTYDPIDTNENDSSADRKITIDEINGADASVAAAGEALTSDGTGSFTFAEVGGADPLTFDETDLSNFVTNDSDLQNLFTQPVLTSSVINSKTAMQEMALSQTAMQEVGLSQTAQEEIVNSFGARRVLNSEATSFSVSYSRDRSVEQKEVIPETDENYAVYISKADYTGFAEDFIGDAGWFDGNDNYLGQNINDVFVDTLTIGWDGGGGSLNETLSGDIEAVIF